MKKFFLSIIFILNISACAAINSENPLAAVHRIAATAKANFDALARIMPSNTTDGQWHNVAHRNYSALKYTETISEKIITEEPQKIYGVAFDIPKNCCFSDEYFLVFRCVQMTVTQTIMGKKSETGEEVLAAKNKYTRTSYIQVFDDEGAPIYIACKETKEMPRIPEADEDWLMPVFPKGAITGL